MHIISMLNNFSPVSQNPSFRCDGEIAKKGGFCILGKLLKNGGFCIWENAKEMGDFAKSMG